MKLNSIILGIIIFIGFCYLYSRGFKEAQSNPSNVYVKAKVGAKVSGAGTAVYNGDYAVGIGSGTIAERCKKGGKEKFCDLTKPWFYNIKNAEYEIWWAPENQWIMGTKDGKKIYYNNFLGMNSKYPPQKGWLAFNKGSGTPPSLIGDETSPVPKKQVTCQLTVDNELVPKKNSGGGIKFNQVSLPTFPSYDPEDKGWKEPKMIRFNIPDNNNPGTLQISGKNSEIGKDGCKTGGLLISCSAPDGNPWNKFGSNQKNWTADGSKGKELNQPSIKPCLSSSGFSLTKDGANLAPNGIKIWAASGQPEAKFEGGPKFGPFPPPAPVCPKNFSGFVQKILSWGKKRENGEQEIETNAGIRGVLAKEAGFIKEQRPAVRELRTWIKQPKNTPPWKTDPISRRFVDKKGTLSLTTSLNKDPIRVPNAYRNCFKGTKAVYTGILSPPIQHCVEQVGFRCNKCSGNYEPSSDKTKCVASPIQNCKKQVGINCEICLDGYKTSKDKKKCDLLPIANCEKQNKAICEKCNGGFYLQKDKKKCMVEVGGCKKQLRGVCVECEKGMQLSNDRKGCKPLPIEYCEVQNGVVCSICKKGYEKSEDGRKCGVDKIEYCADQPVEPGYICNKCERGYELAEGKESCLASKIENCKTQEGNKCEVCGDGFTLRNNRCDESIIPFCDTQKGTKCLKCIDKYSLKDNKCHVILPIKNCTKQDQGKCLECEPHYTLENNACNSTVYGKIDNCEKALGDKCVICNQNFKLEDGECIRKPAVPYCKTQKGNVCTKCISGYNLRGNMCLPGDLQALAKHKKKMQGGPIDRCPPVPECQPGCVDGQGTCVEGLCICNPGWKGDQCQTKIDSRCPVPDVGLPRKWQLVNKNNAKLEKKKFHEYNNTKTPTIPILRTIKSSLAKVSSLLGPDPNDCNINNTCPAPGSMTTEELTRWAQRLRDIRESKRCTPLECPAEYSAANDIKDIKISGRGQKLLSVKAKGKEAFRGSLIANYSNPKVYMRPARTSNMFGLF